MEVVEVNNSIKTEPQQQLVDLGGEEEGVVGEYGEEEEYQYGGEGFHYQEGMAQGLGEGGTAGKPHHPPLTLAMPRWLEPTKTISLPLL